MPEGDSIARVAARLRPLLVGEPLVEVLHRGAAVHDLEGETVAAIDTVGKHLWILVPAVETAIHIHLGMEGRWTLLSPEGLEIQRRRVVSSSIALINRLGGALCARAPVAEIVRGPDARDPAGRSALGPDILAEPLDLDEIIRRARAPGRGDRALGVVLLDQRVCAGIGNLWKSELCFLQSLDPRAPASAHDDATLRALYARAGELMRASVGTAGPATPRETVSALFPEVARRGAAPRGVRYLVYRRDRQPCLRCGTPIIRIVQRATARNDDVGRSTYLCPRCQPRP